MCIRVLIASLIVYGPFVGLANAQQYRPGDGGIVPIVAGQWDGQFGFLNVYCVQFLSPKSALSFGQKFYNGDAIHLARVEYPESLMVNVVVSTIPNGRSAKDEVAKLLKIEQDAERAYSHDYNITTFATRFGETIGLRIKDVAVAGSDGPFPLVRAIYRPGKKPIQSLSVHRIFVRGPDRFEIALYQDAPEGAGSSTETIMIGRLTEHADALVESLQSCTASMPIRSAQ